MGIGRSLPRLPADPDPDPAAIAYEWEGWREEGKDGGKTTRWRRPDGLGEMARSDVK
jgi:hypothetical protein